MRKIFLVLSVILCILIVGFFVSASLENNGNNEDNNLENLNSAKNLSAEVFDKSVSIQAQEYILNFASKRGIYPSEISFVKEVDFDALPKEVNIENVGDSNLAIYEVSYDKEGEEDKVYVITYSVEQLSSQGDLIIAQDKRQFLNFGFSGIKNSSSFLKTATEVETSLEKGYVMVRDGSITAVSTNLEIVKNNPGNIEIIIYVNGEQAGFGNLISTEISEIKKDYDVQSKGVVNFKAGDVISVYLKANGEISWKDVITILEITTIN